MKPLRTAILGCGGFANRHANNLITLPEEIELTAFCDIHEGNAREFSEKYSQGKGAIFTDHRKMFEKANLDLVVICLPPFGHSDEVELAAQHGIHMLIEKPIALTSAEMSLLAALMQHPDMVQPRAKLIADVWSGDDISDRTLDSHLRNLRAKLAKAGAPEAIQTLHGIGIKMGTCPP